MATVIDIQCSKDINNNSFIKELAIVKLGKKQIAHYVFKPPYDWKYLPSEIRHQNCWLENNFHGLGWYQGNVSSSEIFSILLDNIDWGERVYVKGSQKKALLKEQYDLHTFDLESLGCPKPSDLPHYDFGCTYEHTHCALAQALQFARWLETKSIF